jgi:hypothetical protein
MDLSVLSPTVPNGPQKPPGIAATVTEGVGDDGLIAVRYDAPAGEGARAEDGHERVRWIGHPPAVDDDALLIIDSQGDPWAVVWPKTVRGVIDASAHGARGVGTDDTAAIARTLAAVPTATGGEVYVPAGVYLSSSALDLQSRRNVIIEGAGRGWDGAGSGTTIIYTGTGARAIDMRKSIGCSIRNMQIVYNSPSFTGALVDLTNDSGSGANDTRNFSFEGVEFAGSPSTGAINAAQLVKLTNAHSGSFRDCLLTRGVVGAYGRAVSGDYSNAITFDTCTFLNNSTAHTKNAGDAWSHRNCTFEYLTDGTAGAYKHDSGIIANGMVFDSCWAGDITVTSGPQIQVAHNGLAILGGLWASEFAGNTLFGVDENNCSGIVIQGVHLASVGAGATVIGFGSTSGHLGVVIGPNHHRNIAAITSGTVPTSAVIFDQSTGRLRFGNHASANLYQDGAGNAGVKTDGYLAAVGTVFGGGLSISGGPQSLAGSSLGFFGTTPATKPTGVAVTAAGVHAALVSLGLIS